MPGEGRKITKNISQAQKWNSYKEAECNGTNRNEWSAVVQMPASGSAAVLAPNLPHRRRSPAG